MTDCNQTTSIVARAREGRNVDLQENPSNESRDTTGKAPNFPSKLLLSIRRSQPNMHHFEAYAWGVQDTNFQETLPNVNRNRAEEVHCSPIKVLLIS